MFLFVLECTDKLYDPDGTVLPLSFFLVLYMDKVLAFEAHSFDLLFFKRLTLLFRSRATVGGEYCELL